MNALDALARLRGIRALVVGDAMLDRYWFGNVERISPEAPVPVVAVQGEEERLGGAANVAGNIIALGGVAELIAVVGADPAAERIGELCAAAGVRTALIADGGVATTVKLRVLARSQQLMRLDFEATPGADALRALTRRVEQALEACDVLVLSDYGKGALRQVQVLIELARARGIPVVIDPKGNDYAPYAGAALLTPNRQEFAAVAGDWADEAGFLALGSAWQARLGVGGLLVTRSEQGMTLFRPGQAPVHAPARAREVFDVSGAGDTVLAVLCLALVAGVNDAVALELANLAAGVVVGKLGATTATYAELRALLLTKD